MTHGNSAAACRRAAAAASLAVCFAASLSGCGTVSFYNEARDKQAQDLVASAGKVDLTSLVAAVQARFDTLNQLDVATRQEHAEMRRKLAVEVFAGDTKPLSDSYVKRFLDARMTKLAGATMTPAAWRAENDKFIEAKGNEDEAHKALRRLGKVVNADVSSCDDLAKFDAQKLSLAAKALYTPASTHCAAATPPVLVAVPGSLIADLRDELAAAQRENTTRATAIAQVKAAVKAEQAAYDQAVKDATATPDDATYRARLQSAADKLDKGLQAIQKAAQQSGKVQAWLQVSTQENVDALEKLTAVVASGETDVSKLAPDEQRSVLLVRLLPTMADEADKLLKEAQRPRIAPLLLSLDQQRLELESFQQEQKLADKQIASYKQAIDAATQEYYSLGRARYQLDAGQVPLDKSLDDLLASSDPNKPRKLYALYLSLAEFFDHSQVLRSQEEAAEIDARSFTVDREMLRSKYAAQQWQKLLNDMAGVLADYHKSGIKPQDIAEFAKALGLFYIGSQTGK